MTLRPRWLPHPALVFVVLAWGLNFSVIKLIYHEVSPPAVGLLRYLLMLPLLLLWCRLAGQSLRYPKGEFLKFNLAGFVGSGAYMVLFLEGMHSSPAALGAIALATAPVMVTGLSVWAGQDKFTWRLLVGVLVAFGGVAISVFGQSELRPEGSTTGALLVLASAAFWAVSVVLYRSLLVRHQPVRVLALSFPGALVALLPYGYSAMATTEWSKVTWRGWSEMAYLVLVAGVGAFAAYYKGLADVGPARTSMTQFFVPPVAAVFSAFVIPESLDLAEIIGLVIVIAGVVLGTLRARQSSASRSVTTSE